MKYRDFKNLMENKAVEGAYLFMGKEGLIMETTINYLIDTIITDAFRDFNYTHLHGSNLNLNDFYSAIETLPFMSDKRIVVINELQEFLSGQNLSDLFYETLESIPKDTIIILHDSDQNLKKTTKLYKFFNKLNRVVEFEKLNNNELLNFLKRELLKKDKSIQDSDLSYFMMLTGYQNSKVEVNLYDVEKELEKLISYSDKYIITRDDINKTVEKANDSNVFNLLDSLGSKNPGDALMYLHDLYDKNEPIPSILHMVQRRFRHMYAYSSLYEDKNREDEIKKIIGISDFEFKVVSKNSRGKNLCDLRDSLEKILEVDKMLKSTSQNQLMLMEYLVIDICK